MYKNWRLKLKTNIADVIIRIVRRLQFKCTNKTKIMKLFKTDKSPHIKSLVVEGRMISS